ncbi:sensor histidine kinase [Streptosporangium carneum]|uniref:histidine kinase n=1 Tax=Streptosporangium carneum TaxID=47481 RepID=A0A9W6MB37_9ACTN|nr:nitrate- and nitrite sensing domain-containing protein [Streptosporangium carneum]GLK07929.1 histidine kinase [Streptosporangium carneum]
MAAQVFGDSETREGGPPQTADQEKTGRNGSRFAFRNWRVRSRLIALIVIPTTAAVVLGGFRVATSVTSAAQYEQVRVTAELSSSLSGLVHGLQLERDLAARFVAQGRPRGARTKLDEQYGVVDRIAVDVRGRLRDAVEGAFATRERESIAQMSTRLDELATVRKAVVSSSLPAQPVIQTYSQAISDLLALHGKIVQVDADQSLSSGAAAFAALARAKEQASRERAELAVALANRQFTTQGLDDFIVARAQRDSELAAFRGEASLEQRQFYDDTVSGQKIDRAEFIRLRALVLATAHAPLVGVNAANTGAGDQTQWFDASTVIIDKMRTVEKTISDEVITQSRTLQEGEQRGALFAAVASALLLVLVLIITTIMARSLVRPLRRLRTEALSIAGQRLPETVQALRESGDAETAEVLPIGVNSDDEIGEVARAFDEVHREAIRLAGDEARLRSNVNAMFVNLSRRSQTLVERQLSLIESLEQGEQDEHRLGNLFRLDHLATRMRRNSENLLVLAGQEPARRWSQPIPIIDVVRASLSEVENYERVTLQLSAGVSVVGTSVNDVVHLIAELVENAISFSPKETKVLVSSNRIDGGGVMVSVTDVGIGMTADELTQANWRLANPPVVDVSVSRRMGLFVVGRLALRHGIRVQLRQQDSGGLTAMVLIPENLLSAADSRQAPVTQGGGDWAATMGPEDRAATDRPPVLASPTSLDPAQAAFASFEAAQQAFNAFDLRQQFASFETRHAPGDGRPPVDGSWPAAHVPPQGGSPSWSTTSSQADTGVWPGLPVRGGDSADWPNSSQTNQMNTGVWPDAPVRGGDSGVWTSMPARDGDSGIWPSAPAGDSGVWPPPLGNGPFDSRAFDAADSTGPLPVVPESSLMEEAKEEFLPIFAAVESDWFRKVDPAAPAQEGQGEPGVDDTPPATPAPDIWSSPADVGWQAARAASEPTLGGMTGSGLPKRVPKANLVPGTAAPDPTASQPSMFRPAISPEAVRSRLSSFQQGVRQGRAVVRGEVGDGQPYPDFGRDVEGKEDR